MKTAIHRLLALLALAGGMALGTTTAQAHPHVWITAASQVLYAADGSITGVRHAWTFDDMFSTYALQGIETKTKGVYSREQLAPLAKDNVENLREFGFFTFAKADGKRIWTYRHAMVPAEMPTKLLVIGSGAIGIEFASFYNDMGAEVTVVEMLDRIVPVEDADVSAFLEKALKKQGMTIMTGAGVEKIETNASGVKTSIKGKDGKVVTGDYSHVIVAIGIVPNTEEIGLEALGVKTERGHIVTDGTCKTNVDGLYAIGDVTAPPWLAHKASHEGVIAVEAIAGKHPHAMDPLNIPGCTYCHPQIASVGLTEAKAKEAGYEVKAGTFPFIGNGKAIALGEAEGFIKTVFDAKTGELLGAHMIGAEVTELIQGYAVGKTLETTEAELMNTVFPHPTLSEMMHESVLAAYGRQLHM